MVNPFEGCEITRFDSHALQRGFLSSVFTKVMTSHGLAFMTTVAQDTVTIHIDHTHL